jgi:hypothetical protein
LKGNYKRAKFPDDKQSLDDHLKLIRLYNGIDDIFYELLSATNSDLHAIAGINLKKQPQSSLFSNKKTLGNNDLNELYSNFTTYPDEIETCSYQEFIFLKNRIKDSEGKKAEKPLQEMKILNKEALKNKIISIETYNKLEFLRDHSNISERLILFKDYFKVIMRAKNQMRPVSKTYKPIKLEDEFNFSSEKIERFSKLTRRKLLYRKYDETQIILLAQILQKASRRMGTDLDTESGVPYISQEFTVTESDGQRRTYVERFDLDPQSQYNLARRLLRKDMVETQMMDSFVGLKITFDDLVMAAFETGYITVEDIMYVVRYDDLWNPSVSKYKRIMGFVFKVGGYSTFFLPPPFNIIGAIALGIVEGIVDSKNQSGAENDNPATFIE